METVMRCLSVKQPWASLIASGRKTIEVRSWSTKYRGPLIVCASAAPDRRPFARAHELGPTGVAVCTVELVDVRLLLESDAGAACVSLPIDGLYAWVLRDARPVTELVPTKGQLGLYCPGPELTAALAR
jgi:hypothetical protein